MKVVCEVSSESSDPHVCPEFNWLKDHLLIVERYRKLRLLDVSRDPAKELKHATIDEARKCTSYSWNYDSTLLAIVIDARQLYIWTVEGNVFTHIKPANRYTIDRESRKQRPKEISAIGWSQVSNKLVLCYVTGQLLLCGFSSSSVTEKFVDNSDGLLRSVIEVTASQTLDIFICMSCTNEVLVMTFDGQALLYTQTDDKVFGVRLSHFIRTQDFGPQVCERLWLASRTPKLVSFRNVLTGGCTHGHQETTKQYEIQYELSPDRTVVDFHWVDESRMILCFADGNIELIELELVTYGKDDGNFRVVCSEVIDVSRGHDTALIDKTSGFKAFIYLDNEKRARRMRKTHTASLLAMTDYHIKYFRLHRIDNLVSIERVDEVDLSENLQSIHQTLIDAKWSHGCQMLAVQLQSGHILVYRASLTNYMVAIKGPKVAYMSDIEEITVLNYEPINNILHTGSESEPKAKERSLENESKSPTSTTNARVIGVKFQPSLIAIGVNHLAVALNNRLRFYNIGGPEDAFFEEEYPTIIDGISLCSTYVAVHLKDGRLKLQAINLIKSGRSTSPIDDMSLIERSDERYFPDPANPEKIVTFTLTESLLVYCNHRCRMTLFCLQQWLPVQVFLYSAIIDQPIKKLVPNSRGNKILCIFDTSHSRVGNCCLYDIYHNTMNLIIDNKDELNELLSDNRGTDQEPEVPSEGVMKPFHDEIDRDSRTSKSPKKRLNHITDAIWDTDGRSFLLVEQNMVHLITQLDHTYDKGVSCTYYIDELEKPCDSNTLYVSQGIVSFQNCLGRVINTILPSYDDEFQLTQIEQQIEQLKSESIDSQQVIARVDAIKARYLKNILPIYSLSRCKEICNYLMTEAQFNLGASVEQNSHSPVWKLLALWALFTMNLEFALMVCRKHEMASQAQILDRLVKSTSLKSNDDIRKEIGVLLNELKAK